MVFVGRNSNRFAGASRARFAGARRVGQANGLNGMVANEVDQEQLQLQGVENPLNEGQTIDQFEGALAIDLDGGHDADNGDRVVVITDAAQPEVQVVARLPAAAAPVAEECEFPVQAVVLQRQVNITNSAPRIVNADTDICGNLISYTELMTRTMTAGAWVAESGLQGPVDNLNVEPNGEISLSYDAGGDIANSRGFADVNFPYQVTSQQRVGRRAGAVRRAGGMNANAHYGAAQLTRFRHG